MSTKGLRHHMVMNSHHHRWATRRTISATQSLSKKHAVHTPVHKGRRVKQTKPHKISSQSSASLQEPPPAPPGRGSFDAFFSSQFGDKPALPSSTSASDQSPRAVKKTKIQPNPYSPHLFLPLEHGSELDQGEFDSKPDGKIWIPSQLNPNTSSQIITTDTFVSPTEINLHPIHPYFADLGLPCGSVHNTLSHLYAAENLWQQRYQGQVSPHKLTKLWGPEFESSSFQWSDYCSQELGLPLINLDTSRHIDTNAGISSNGDVYHLLDMSLDDQFDLAQTMLSKLSFKLDDQNTQWISLIQGTTEPDLFNDLTYFGTEYTPSRGGTEVTLEDFTTDKAKLSSMPRLVALNHLFMHATHHRGQILSTSSQFTGEQTVVDLSAFHSEWKILHSKVFRWA